MSDAVLHVEGRIAVRRPRRQRFVGFTLVEMMVVLVLIGLLAGSVVVAFEGRDADHAVRVAAEDLAEATRYAHREARVTQRPHRLVFDEAMRSFHVEWRPLDGQWRSVNGRPGRERVMPGGVWAEVDSSEQTPDGEPVTLTFDPAGGFVGRIRLVGEGGRVRVLESFAETGQVNVLKP